MSDNVSRKAELYKNEVTLHNWRDEDYKAAITTSLPFLVENTTEACLSTLCLHMESTHNLTKKDVAHIMSKTILYQKNEEFYNTISMKRSCDVLPLLLSVMEENAAENLVEQIRSKMPVQDNFVIECWSYTTNEVLGSGSFGVVISATNTIDQLTYAMKVIPNRKVLFGDTKDILRELRNQAKLDHPNVVKYKSSDKFSLSTNQIKEILQWDHTTKISNYTHEFFRAYFDSANNGLVTGFIIKMELCGETLREWLNKLSMENNQPTSSTCELIAQGIADGLCYIHSKEIIHRDLRPDNIYFSNSNFVPPVKIGDFGLSISSKIYEQQTMSMAPWNTQYRALEMNKVNADGKAKYGQHVDWFSFGLILSEIFDPTNENNLIGKFGKIIYARTTGINIQKISWLNDVILRLTDEEPHKRIELQDIAKGMPIKFSFLSKELDAQSEGTNTIPVMAFYVYQDYIDKCSNKFLNEDDVKVAHEEALQKSSDHLHQQMENQSISKEAKVEVQKQFDEMVAGRYKQFREEVEAKLKNMEETVKKHIISMKQNYIDGINDQCTKFTTF